MPRHNRLKDLARVLEAKELVRLEAAQTLAGIRTREDERRREEDLAEQNARDSAAAWQTCLSAGTFDLQSLSYLAAELGVRHAELDAARESHGNAKRRTELANAHYASCEAQVSQTELVVQRLRKKLLRSADERQLSAIEDRVAYLWVAR